MSGAKVVAEAGSAGEIAVKADAGLSKSYLPVKDQAPRSWKSRARPPISR